MINMEIGASEHGLFAQEITKCDDDYDESSHNKSHVLHAKNRANSPICLLPSRHTHIHICTHEISFVFS